MRSSLLLSLAILFGSAIAANAQSATLVITPKRVTVHPSQPAVFTVKAIPSNGFSAPIYLTASSATIKTGGSLSAAQLTSATYESGVRMTITPEPKDTGTHLVVVEGKNGALRTYDSCYIDVTPRVDRAWTIYAPWNSPMPDSNVRYILLDRNDVGWMATARGLARFDRTTWTIYDSTNSSLPFSDITTVAADSNGSIWVGGSMVDSSIYNEENGWRLTRPVIAELVDGVWAVYTDLNSQMEGSRVNMIQASKDGAVWIGTDSGLVRFDGTSWTRFYNEAPLAPPLYFPNVIGIVCDSAGAVWALSKPRFGRMHMQKFDGQFWTPIDIDQTSLPDSRLWMDRSGKIWLTFEEQGIGWIEGTKLQRRNPNWWLFPGGAPTSMAFSHDGITWIGNATRGQYPYFALCAQYGTNWRTFSPANSGLPDETVRSLAVDDDGVVWIGTEKFGLVLFDPSLEDISSVESSGATTTPGRAITALYPNPTNEKATVRFNLAAAERVRIALVDGRGSVIREILDERRSAGEGAITFGTDGIVSGLYFVRITAGDLSEVRALVVR